MLHVRSFVVPELCHSSCNRLKINVAKLLGMFVLIRHPPSSEHFSLKIDVRDQTIWNCILEL